MPPRSQQHTTNPEVIKSMREMDALLRKHGYKQSWWSRIKYKVCALIIWSCLLGVIGIGAYWIHASYLPQRRLLTIDNIEYHSNGIIPLSAVMEALDIHGKEIEIHQLQELDNKLKKLPEVSEASVTYIFPETLRIEVQPRLPVAWLDCPSAEVKAKDTIYGLYTDKEGIPFQSHPVRYKDYADIPIICLPVPPSGMIVPGVKPEKIEQPLELLRLILKEISGDLPKPTKIYREKEWAFCVEFDSGTQAVFSTTDLPAQIRDLIPILHDVKFNNTPVRINLAYRKNIRVSPLPAQQGK